VKTRYFQAFFLDQDKPNQGRKVKSWRPRQKESAQENQAGSWRAASSPQGFHALRSGFNRTDPMRDKSPAQAKEVWQTRFAGGQRPVRRASMH